MPPPGERLLRYAQPRTFEIRQDADCNQAHRATRGCCRLGAPAEGSGAEGQRGQGARWRHPDHQDLRMTAAPSGGSYRSRQDWIAVRAEGRQDQVTLTAILDTLIG